MFGGMESTPLRRNIPVGLPLAPAKKSPFTPAMVALDASLACI